MVFTDLDFHVKFSMIPLILSIFFIRISIYYLLPLILTIGTRTFYFWFKLMAIMRYELSLFALWQVKMHVILTRMDLEDFLLGIEKMSSSGQHKRNMPSFGQ